MQLISERLGQEIGKVPHRIDRAYSPTDIGIDFVEVAESHVLFFGQVKEYVHGRLTVSREEFLGFEQSCELDQWLRADGRERFSLMRAFERLCEAHEDFHRYALEVIDMLQSGSWVTAEHMRKTELSQALRRVLIALTELNETINKEAVKVS